MSTYHIKRNGKLYGPFSLDAVAKCINTDIFTAKDEISENQINWVTIEKFQAEQMIFKQDSSKSQCDDVQKAHPSPSTPESAHRIPQTATSSHKQNLSEKNTSQKSLWQYFVDAFLKKYSDWTGRACRKEFWGYILFLIIFSAVIGFLVGYFCGFGLIFQICSSIWGVLSFMPWFSLLIRRMHDLGKSGKIIGAILITLNVIGLLVSIMTLTDSTPSNLQSFIGTANLILGIVILIIGCIKGQSGENQYGPDPLQ